MCCGILKKQRIKSFKNSLDKLLPKKLIPVVVELSKNPTGQENPRGHKAGTPAAGYAVKEFQVDPYGTARLSGSHYHAGRCECQRKSIPATDGIKAGIRCVFCG